MINGTCTRIEMAVFLEKSTTTRTKGDTHTHTHTHTHIDKNFLFENVQLFDRMRLTQRDYANVFIRLSVDLL